MFRRCFECQSPSTYTSHALLLIVMLHGPGCGGSSSESGAVPATDNEDPVEQTLAEQKWRFTGYLLGSQAGNESSGGSLTMADTLRIGNMYYMYYNIDKPDSHDIGYATSADGFNWQAQGVVLSGSSDPLDRTFITGGPSVVPMPDGRYRMYLRAAPAHEEGTPPEYHVLSAISNDGENFEMESGVRIEINAFDADSIFTLAGHGRYFINQDGLYVGVFSANDLEKTGASDLWIGTSSDGLNWGNYVKLYENWHDPTIEPTEDGYVMYATYLDQRQGRAISSDGVTWSAMFDVSLLDEENNALTEGQNGVGDLATLILADGELLLLSNFGKPSTDIVYYRLE